MAKDTNLYYLVYISRQSYPLNRSELRQILDAADHFNQQHQVTGMLVYRNGSFLQVLEGEKDTIRTLYDSIRQDRRHTDVQQVIFEPARQRYFQRWTMGFCELATQADEELKAYSTFLRHGLCAHNAPIEPSIPASMLSMFIYDFSAAAEVVH